MEIENRFCLQPKPTASIKSITQKSFFIEKTEAVAEHQNSKNHHEVHKEHEAWKTRFSNQESVLAIKGGNGYHKCGSKGFSLILHDLRALHGG